jgi:hypothetical protein
VRAFCKKYGEDYRAKLKRLCIISCERTPFVLPIRIQTYSVDLMA